MVSELTGRPSLLWYHEKRRAYWVAACLHRHRARALFRTPSFLHAMLFTVMTLKFEPIRSARAHAPTLCFSNLH